MIIRFLLISLLLISFIKSVNAQTDSVLIRGMVISGKSKLPIREAVIIVKNSSLGTISDSLGNFKFKIPFTEKVYLEVRYIGYDHTDTVIVSDNNEYGFLQLYLNYTCDIISKETAFEDIRNDSIILYIFGFPIYNEKQEKIDDEFQKKFNIVYDDVGDSPPASPQCLIEYNIQIFNYLDKKYENKWHSKVNKSVSGYEDFLKNKK